MSSGCGTVGYYSQAVSGHLKMMRARQPIDELLSNKDTDPELRKKLQILTDARVFAAEQLRLPNNDSYSTYVATGRKYVTWNVVAADEFSVTARTWCFPVAGCVSYRGYFAEEDAKKYAAGLAEQGMDISIGGASAYSTLGWFDDPVLDTMLRGNDIRYVSTLFHELSHQVVYVKNDSNFNEAFATFVEQQSTRIWLESRDEADRIELYDAYLKRGEQFSGLLKQTRGELQELYAGNLAADEKRQAKQKLFDQLRDRYEQLKTSWNSYRGYDGWFARELNNARLVSVATYRRYVPAFEAMYEEVGQDIDAFYILAKSVSQLPIDERRERLDAYL